MLIYLFFWYVILVLWARRSLPSNRQIWITGRFLRAQTSIIILALLIARHSLTHWTGHEAYRYSSELVSESIQMKLCCFFFLDIFVMRP
jgi:hypothetical protein